MQVKILPSSLKKLLYVRETMVFNEPILLAVRD